ncbi:MAG: 16S rRNA (cytidine(1402)-2'-O)-methyltransferase [Dehalococcoidales bacterium]|nr:MAG: 16S rRNA (cytidine(1402)-2'-O)-methyltransferase [Dehalococcoidales bacterium]
MPILYVVATPIGNLEDISLRALRVLREVKLIAAEDTRKTKRLLTRYDITTPLASFHEHTRTPKINRILEHLEEGDVALVSEAGMPGISDPGYEIVTAAIQRGFQVVPIPGPSVVTAALAVSGLPTDRFIYLGFLPSRSSGRCRLLESVAGEPSTLVIFEAPHRLTASMTDMLSIFGDRSLAVCRELTKLHEEVFRGSISQALEHFTKPRGEFTLVIEGKRDSEKPRLTDDIEQWLKQMRRSGLPAREAIARVAWETHLSKKELYQAWLRLV